MKIIKIFIVAILFILFTGIEKGNAHPFYVSICQINFNEQNHSLEISVKIFADDLQTALNNRNIEDLFMGDDREKPETDQYISAYLKDKLSISIDEKPIQFSFLGKEQEDDAFWCFLETKNVNSLDSIEVTNTILTEIFDTQSNIVQVTSKGKTKNLLLRKGNTKGDLTF